MASESSDEQLEQARRALADLWNNMPQHRAARYQAGQGFGTTVSYHGTVRTYPHLDDLVGQVGGAPLSQEGLERVDDAIAQREFEDMDRNQIALEISLYYGDVIVKSHPSAYWIIEQGRFPRVQLDQEHFIDMFLIAKDNIERGRPFLRQAFDRLISFTSRGDRPGHS
ncbi:hypothetical protein [Sinomonas mesophila]|uniref:hypothetical protein n=1 Tax=Sinomonas mesophila TaxID=1531955 RepID=UPI0011159D80|nr:hypothetical protein [Sinomonas mesophila]